MAAPAIARERSPFILPNDRTDACENQSDEYFALLNSTEATVRRCELDLIRFQRRENSLRR
jgi:hypothetical protein